MIKVFGHKSPDTDSVLSAIVFAWYLNNVVRKEATAYINGEPNNETTYLLNRFEIACPEKLVLEAGDEVVIVDTNNPEELPANISEAKILEIVDHHKMSGLATASPVTVTIRPVASTTSLIFSQFFRGIADGVDSNIIALMLAGILSDTLEFRSPTTTELDKYNASVLAEVLKIDMSELATEMFNAKSDISKYSAKELVLLDSKVFNIKGKNLRISSMETTNPAASLDQKQQIKEAMEVIKKDENLDDVLFFVIDILKEEAHLIVSSESAKALCETAFGKPVDGDTVVLPGVLSRKKQIIPQLEK
jgi:manganese-dependent inorganic pyrophosphatase